MPRAKDNTDAVTESEHGFAALEAKVEEVQLDATIEAELAMEDAAAAAPLTRLQPDAETAEPVRAAAIDAATVAPQTGYKAAVPTSAAPLQSLLGAFAACAESSLRLQTETLASFSRARSPADLLAAQMDYGRQVLKLYTSNATRLTQAAFPVGR